jgi:hypothetical protein
MVLQVLLIGIGLALATRSDSVASTSVLEQVPGARPFSVTPQELRQSGHLGAVASTGPSRSVPTTVRPARHDSAGCPQRLLPGHILIPNLCIDGALQTTSRRSDGALVIPESVRQVGLWDGGSGLTDARGTTLLAGHVTSAGQGAGALFRLSLVQPGDEVYLVDQAGHARRWVVIELQEVARTRLPDNVFAGRTGPRTLKVVTCGGPVIPARGGGWGYRDNIIVTAVPG